MEQRIFLSFVTVPNLSTLLLKIWWYVHVYIKTCTIFPSWLIRFCILVLITEKSIRMHIVVTFHRI